MAHTLHHRFSTPDPWRVGHKLERQARPAGRVATLVAAELDAEADGGEDLFISFVPAPGDPVDEDLSDEFDCGLTWGSDATGSPRHTSNPCGGWCRRCYIHDDPGGCLTQWEIDRNLLEILGGFGPNWLETIRWSEL